MYDIKIKNITKRYDDILAVDNVSVHIPEGTIFGLLGPNGAGKSTMINMLCGLLSLDNGDILVGSNSIKSSPHDIKKNIGYIPQEIALFEGLTVKDNLDYFGRLYGLSGTTLKARMEHALEITELKDKRKMTVKKLSGGMKRRLNIACAIMHKPKILVMDEPTVGVDPQSRNHILEFVRKVNKDSKTTVIYTSHYMEEIEAVCDEILIMDLGRELLKGTKEEILRSVIDETYIEIKTESFNSSVSSALKSLDCVKSVSAKDSLVKIVTSSAEMNIEKIIHEFKNRNNKILNISIKQPNLETVFLSITGKKLRD